MSIDFHNTLKYRRDKLIQDISQEENTQITVDREFLQRALQFLEKVQIQVFQKRRSRDGDYMPTTELEREIQAVQENIARAFYEDGEWPLEYFDTEDEEDED